MKNKVCVVGLVLGLLASPAMAGEQGKAEQSIDGVLDALHQAASDADGDVYFDLFADGAVFMGTDATERWSIEEFKAYAEPYFSQGRGWTYIKTKRHIYVAAGGETAWFDEMLSNENYGTCRGTGVLVLVDGAWKFSHYNLTIPIPNDLAAEFSSKIKSLEADAAAKK